MRRIWEVGVAHSPVIGRRRGAFSTLLRRPGLRASSDCVLATKSERKMLASTCLYSLYAWFISASQSMHINTRTHDHTTTVYGPYSGTTRVSRCQKRTSGLLWCKGTLTEADTPTIRLGATSSGLTSAHLHHPPHFLQAGCPSCRPNNRVKALKATSAFGLGRRR